MAKNKATKEKKSETQKKDIEKNENIKEAELLTEDDDIEIDEDDDLDLDDDGPGVDEDGKDDALALIEHLPPSTYKDSLQTYLREINRFPLLEPDEEYELATRVQESGDPDAAFRLVSSHLRLVVRIAMGFQRS